METVADKEIIFKVLWVDDEINDLEDVICEFKDTYQESGKIYSLNVEPVTNWEDAKKLLEADIREIDPEKKFIAVILDANCKVKKDDEANMSKFLIEVLKSVWIYKKPYFIFSGQGQEKILAYIDFDESDPDYLWKKEHNKAFYSKTTDCDALKKNIIEYGIRQTEYKIRNELYSVVFDGIKKIGFDNEVRKEVEENIIDLLKPIHFGGCSTKDYTRRASCIRESVEHIFRSMYVHGMLPKGYVNSQERNRVNFNGCFKILCEKYLPPIAREAVPSMKSLISKFHHTGDNFHEYYNNNGNSYLVCSVVFWLCDFIVWYSNYVDKHGKEENEGKWKEEATLINDIGMDGKLHWSHDKWVIKKYNGEEILVDEKEGARKKGKYIEGMDCNFILKEFKSKERGVQRYAICIDPVYT